MNVFPQDLATWHLLAASFPMALTVTATIAAFVWVLETLYYISPHAGRDLGCRFLRHRPSGRAIESHVTHDARPCGGSCPDDVVQFDCLRRHAISDFHLLLLARKTDDDRTQSARSAHCAVHIDTASARHFGAGACRYTKRYAPDPSKRSLNFPTRNVPKTGQCRCVYTCDV